MKRIAFAICFVLLAGVLSCPADASAATLVGLRTGTHEDHLRIVLDFEGEADYRSLVLSDPDRILIDLPSVEASEFAVPSVRDRVVKGIRVNRQVEGKSQVVLDLAAAARHKIFTVPPGDGRGFRVVCDVYHDAGAVAESAPASNETANQAGEKKSDAAMASKEGANPDAKPGAQEGAKQDAKADAKQDAKQEHKQEPAQGANPDGAKPLDKNAQDKKVPDDMANGGKAPAFSATPPVPMPAPTGSKPWVVIVDPGHGGRDPGAQHRGLDEKEVVLDVARQLVDRLNEQPGVRAHLTREKDALLSLKQRIRKAEAKEADVFVSLHVNGCHAPSASGAEVFYLSLKGADDVETRELATLENLARSEAEDPYIGEIAELPFAVDLIQTDTMRRSSLLAEAILDALVSAELATSRGVKQANFVVLRSCRVPSALVELGFISNPQEADRLRSPKHRTLLAEKIAAGLLEFRARYARHAEGG
ncbi:MAG: N-acetylmuramoyl-L-alanine amidase [Candidatus Eisenbacteria bacterium]|nr:N-acetylmuramoyl-L-alanine amidase [Candidatus Eisenbacteria bacterium]